jgi:hypothetical protein
MRTARLGRTFSLAFAAGIALFAAGGLTAARPSPDAGSGPGTRPQRDDPNRQEWIQLFNGEFGHLFYKEPFSYYRLVAEYRFVGSQVSGGPAWAMRNSRTTRATT